MSAMAEHDCITTHDPTCTAGAIASAWVCPDCEAIWLYSTTIAGWVLLLMPPADVKL